MSEIDERLLRLYSEDDMLLQSVVQEDTELLLLDTYLTDIFKSHKEY